ncbi:MAG: hypothetical protein EON58_15310 [Alphaproteobacteria bacterium]|nr:MAG: hypothetical protein EON58_15310 [Alphaproteobacteria bacterium]
MLDEPQNVAAFTFDGADWRLKGWPKVSKFVDDLWEFWSPLDGHRLNDPVNAAGNISGRITQIRNEILSAQSRGENVSQFSAVLLNLLEQQYGPYHPEGRIGSLIKDVADTAGPEAALFAYSTVRNLVTPGQASTINHFRGVMMVAFPTSVNTIAAEERLAAERNNFRSSARRLSDEIETEQNERSRIWDELLKDASIRADAWVRRRSSGWRRNLSRWRGNTNAAISSIEATERSYREFMRLKAPATYWTDKAGEHRALESKAVTRVIFFFTLSLPVMGLMFFGAADYLLRYGGSNPPPGLYIISGAGLATTAGLLFWVGRLLTKLYLSQHHLRQDAEERAVMTTTYLALTADQAAGDADRQIILSALFRATSDGIIKEDGGLDASIPSLISRLAAR